MVEASFGEWLKRQRRAAGLTQEQLAEQVSCSTITLRKIEAEERRPSVQMVERLAEIFNIPPTERTAFLRFARGDWQAAPMGGTENASWLAMPPSSAHPKTHLATFLFTDIESSAKLWENAPDKMKVALQRHHEILQKVISANGGTVFQIVGDAFCAAFPTVFAAVSAAVTIQQELQREQWDLPFPIRVRMGIHTGEAEKTASDNYASGPTLNRVARILTAAHGGQVLLSLATKDLVKDSLPANTDLRDMGEHYLKNLMYPEHFFQLDIAGLPSDFPPLNTLTHRHNLPVQVTSFIAREAEIALVHEYLSNDDIRLVTLIGPPGIGKTRLSIEAARAVLPDFPDGVFFVGLAPLDDPSLIALTIVRALGYVEAKNMTANQQLMDGIGDKQMLIVLDNCEHLIEEVARLASGLLSACSRLKILATSRESLRIPGEWLYPVPALGIPAFDVPGEHLSIDIETASSFPALTLFTERARAVRPDIALNADNIRTVSEICAHLDGLPLVIELIAARMRLMSPQALLDRLTSQFVLTADGMRAATERQKTLNNAINWSYNLLSPEEQKLFAYLSVFSGGFTVEVAEAILSRVFKEKSVSNLIVSLLDKSLLQRSASEHGEPRFTMLVTIQEFARERLRDIGEEEIRNLHLAYFLDLAERADKQIRGPDQLKWIDRIEDELDNFRAALSWCISNQKVEPALCLLTRLSEAWLKRDHLHEMRSWFNAIRLLPGIMDYPLLHARLLNHVGHHSWLLSDLDYASSILEEGREILTNLGVEGEQDLGMTMCWLGMVERMGGRDPKVAQSFFERSFELYQRHGEQWGMAFDLLNLGILASKRNDDGLALSLFEQSTDLFQQLGDPWGIARVSQQQGEVLLKQGNFEKAHFFLNQHLLIDEKLQFKQGTAMALYNMGNLYCYQGNCDQAEPFFEKTLALSRDYGSKWDESLAYYGLGLIALHRSDYEKTTRYFKNYFVLHRHVWETAATVDLVYGLAAIAAGTNQFERAAKLYGAAQALFETTDYRLQPFDRIEFDRHIRIAEERLGGTKFEELVSEGYAMTMEQAIAYALEKDKF